MLRIPLSQCYALGCRFPEYADGTLRKLTANLSLCPLVSSVPWTLHTRLPCKAPYMHGKRKGVIAGPSGHSVRDEHLCKIAELAENTLAVRSPLHASQGRCLKKRKNAKTLNHRS